MGKTNRAITYLLRAAIIVAALLALTATIISFKYLQAEKQIADRPLTQCGTILKESDLSFRLIVGVIAQEDVRFFSTDGVDYHEIINSLISNIRQGRVVRGASTITMQVASLCYLNQDGNRWIQKLNQAIYAKILAKQNSKSEILRAYLTIVPLAPNPSVIGFPEAAEYYFHKPVTDLSEQEEWRLILALRNRHTLNPNLVADPLELKGPLRESIIRAQERQVEGMTSGWLFSPEVQEVLKGITAK